MYRPRIAICYVSAILLLCLASCSRPPADTVDNRRTAVERYFRLVPMKTQIASVGEAIASQLPEAERGKFTDVWNNRVSWDKIQSAAADIMVRDLTVSEIAKIADLIDKNPDLLAIQTKIGHAMADPVMQQIVQAEMKAALQTAGFR